MKQTLNLDKTQGVVFAVKNTINDFVYIACSCNYAHYTWNIKNCLKNKNFVNPNLQNFVNEFGVDCILFEVLEVCEQSVLEDTKQKWLDLTQNKYNKNETFEKPYQKKGKYYPTIEHKQRLSNLRKQNPTKLFGEKNGMFGKKMSDKNKQNLSKIHKGKKIPDDVIAKRIETRKKNSIK